MVSFEKSYVKFSRNTPSTFVRFMCRPLGFPCKDVLFVLDEYLGCPVKVDGRHTLIFKSWVDKIARRISSWQYSLVSQASRLVLIYFVLGTMLYDLWRFICYLGSYRVQCLFDFGGKDVGQQSRFTGGARSYYKNTSLKGGLV